MARCAGASSPSSPAPRRLPIPLRGPLVLQGHGDPTLSHLDLRVLARQVRTAGIRKVAGSVLGDESYFDSRRTAPGWKPSFYINESAPLSALTVDRTWFHDHHSRV